MGHMCLFIVLWTKLTQTKSKLYFKATNKISDTAWHVARERALLTKQLSLSLLFTNDTTHQFKQCNMAGLHVAMFTLHCFKNNSVIEEKYFT